MDGIKLIPQIDGTSLNIKKVTDQNNEKYFKNQESDFFKTLSEAISKVNELQVQANKQAENFAVGRTDNIADVMIAMEKADLALRLMMQVRNKVLDSYQEIMKMQV